MSSTASLPHEMVAWKAAAEDLAAQRDALSASLASAEAVNAELVEALREIEQSYRDLTEQSDAGALDYVHAIQRGHGDYPRLERARAALARAGGSKPKERL